MSWRLQRRPLKSKSVRGKVRLNLAFSIVLPDVADFALVTVLPKSAPTVDESADELARDDPQQTVQAELMGSDTTGSLAA
jgi:hypothetical protein